MISRTCLGDGFYCLRKVRGEEWEKPAIVRWSGFEEGEFTVTCEMAAHGATRVSLSEVDRGAGISGKVFWAGGGTFDGRWYFSAGGGGDPLPWFA